jgi:hypothetical protein
MASTRAIVVVEPDPARGEMIAKALREDAGATDIHVIADLGGLAASITRRPPTSC